MKKQAACALLFATLVGVATPARSGGDAAAAETSEPAKGDAIERLRFEGAHAEIAATPGVVFLDLYADW